LILFNNLSVYIRIYNPLIFNVIYPLLGICIDLHTVGKEKSYSNVNGKTFNIKALLPTTGVSGDKQKEP
jgi:hypothetical protein